MKSLVFEGNTWQVYENLRKKDKKLHQNLVQVLKEILRDDPAKGIGKPEALKHQLSGLWSRRISSKDRLVYSWDKNSIYIFAIGGHYNQK